MDQYADLFLLYFLLNFAFILGLIIGSVAGFPKNRENAVTAVLFAVTTVDLFLMMGLVNLYLGLVVSLVYVFTSDRYEERMFARFLTPLRSVIYILCLQALSSIGTYFVTRYANLVVVIGVFHLIYIVLTLHSFRIPTLEEWTTK